MPGLLGTLRRRLGDAEGVGDEGLAMDVMGGVEGLIAVGFERGDCGVELAGGDFVRRGGGVAELAVGEVAVQGPVAGSSTGQGSSLA